MAGIENEFFKSLNKFKILLDNVKEIDIKFPRICLVGIPNSGKSILLESIIGYDILPVGEGVVTRRPLELYLNHIDSRETYAIFEEIPDTIFTDFSKISEIIQALTEEECKKYYSDKPIILNMYSHNFPDVSFFDLPGTTFIPIGECPTNKKEFPTLLADKYIENHLNLILCLIPRNEFNDYKLYCLKIVSNREGALLKSSRVLGVITKMDIINETETDIKEFLLNKYIPLKFGYVGVKNRSLNDLIYKISLKESLKNEKKYFQEHDEYRSIPKDLLGYGALINKLKKTYFEMIKEHLPEEIKILNKKIIKKEFIENYHKKRNVIELLKFINNNSFKGNEAYKECKKNEIRLEKKEDYIKLIELYNFIYENAEDI